MTHQTNQQGIAFVFPPEIFPRGCSKSFSSGASAPSRFCLAWDFLFPPVPLLTWCLLAAVTGNASQELPFGEPFPPGVSRDPLIINPKESTGQVALIGISPLMVCVPSPLQLLPRMSSVLLLLLLLPFSAGNAGSQPGQALPRRRLSCVRCCGPSEQPVSVLSQRSARMSGEPRYSLPKIQPTINITILKGGCSSFPACSLLLFLWAFPAAKFGKKIRAKGKMCPEVSKITVPKMWLYAKVTKIRSRGAQNMIVPKSV